MFNFTYILLLIISICNNSCTQVESVNICKGVCNGKPDHAFCKYPKEGPGPNCEFYTGLSLSEDEKISLLDRLNERRNRVAAGMVTYMPPAANMMKLVWNDDLSAMAQRWVDQCIKPQNPDETHTCQDLETMPIGQNIATVLGNTPGLTNTALVEMWYMESFEYNQTYIFNYQPSCDVGRRHFDYFTQLIWAKSFMVGCGRATFTEKYNNEKKKQTVHRLVCNFAPSGNVVGRQVYSVGLPCSECPNGTKCDTVLKGLCKTNNLWKMDLNLTSENYNDDNTTKLTGNKDLFASSAPEMKEDINFGENSTNSYSSYNQSPSTTDIETEESPFELIDLIYSRKPLLDDPKRTQHPDPFKINVDIDKIVEIVKERLKNDSSFLQSLSSDNNYRNMSFIQRNVGETLNLMSHSSNNTQVNDILNLVYTAYPTPSIIYTSPDDDVTNSTVLNELADLMGIQSNGSDEIMDYDTTEPDISTVKGPSFDEQIDQIISGDSPDYVESTTLGTSESDTETISYETIPSITTKSFLDIILDEENDHTASTTAVFVFSPEIAFESRGQKSIKKWHTTNTNQTNNVPFNFF